MSFSGLERLGFQRSCLFYFSLPPPPPEETLVNTVMIGQGQKNTSAVGAHQGSAEPNLLAACACGKVRLAAMVKSPQEGEQKPGRGLGVPGWVCRHMPVIPGVRWWKEAGRLQSPGQHGRRRKNTKAERNTTPKMKTIEPSVH